MISKEEFLDKVRIEVFPLLEKLEKERETTLFYSFILFLVAFFIFLISFVFFEKGTFFSVVIFLCAGFIAAAGYFISSEFLNTQKRKFGKIFFSFLSEDVITSQKLINERNIKKSLLFQSFNQFKKKASFSGILSNTTFSILECILLENCGRARLKRFQGVIISFPIDKKIKKHTLLLKKSMFRFRFGLEQIVLECIEANNKYKIYSESQQEARYLLSPVFLEKLTKIKKIFRCSYVDISFFDGKMMLAFHTRKNLFESYHLFQNALDIRLYERFYDEVDSIRKLINFLNIENKHLFKKHPLNSTNSVKLRKINEIRSTFVTILCFLLYLGAIFLLLYLGRLFPSGFIAEALRFVLTLISTGGILFSYGIL